ncbi:MAG TPA: hypothetical protein PK156_07505 [Polyangium sp.]|nr:hypothetical protein [Polyangium sp.]
MNRALGLVALSLFALTACVVEPGTDDESMEESDIAPDVDGKAVMPVRGYAGTTSNATSSITYHGGKIMGAGVKVYMIWYGAFNGGSGSSTSYKSIMNDLISGIGSSAYYAINTSYTDSTGASVQKSVTLAGQQDFGYLSGKTRLTDANIKTVVTTAIANGLGPAGGDENGLYLVLTSKDVTASSGFCNQYCGWHTHATINNKNIKYSFVGDANRCLSSCADQTTSPNGDPGADGAASVVAHELVETASDPDLNAWYDSSGAENADKCAWNFGATSTASNGSLYNMSISGRQYLIQQNWSAASQSCGLK